MKRWMTKWVSALLCAAVAAGLLPVAAAVDNTVTSSTLPTSVEVKWTADVGSGLTTSPVTADQAVYVASGDTLYKIDSDSGKIAKKGTMSGSVSAAKNAPTVSGDRVFVGLDNGTVEAFDADTLQSQWVSAKLDGAVSSALTVNKDYLYGGTDGSSGAFFCLKISGGSEKEANPFVWTVSHSEEFSSTGCYADDDTVVFASGTTLYSVKAATGDTLGHVDVIGAISTPVVSSTSQLFFGTKEGTVYRVSLQTDGTLDKLVSGDCGGAATTAPTIANGKVYVGTDKNTISVLKNSTDSLETAYQTTVNFTPKGALLAAKDQIYFTQSSETGGVSYTETKEDATVHTLFTPDAKQQESSSSSVVADGGVLYYTNDSHTLFALQEKTVTPEPEQITLSKLSGQRKTATTGTVTFTSSADGTCYYAVTATDAEKPDVFSGKRKMSIKSGENTISFTDLDQSGAAQKVWVGVKGTDGTESAVESVTLASYAGQTKIQYTVTVSPWDAKITVDPSLSAEHKNLGNGKHSYMLVVGETYTFTVEKTGYRTQTKKIPVEASSDGCTVTLKSKNDKLSHLSVSSSRGYTENGFTLSPSFASGTETYTAQSSEDPSTMYLWVKKSSDKATCHAYGDECVSTKSMSSDSSLYGKTMSSGYQRYAFQMKGTNYTAKLTIAVKAEDGTKKKYTVTVSKTDKTAPTLSTVSKSRTGEKTGQIILQSSEKATGYLKMVASGQTATNVEQSTVTFGIAKGKTTLNLSGISTATAREVYIVAEDGAGNWSKKLKVSIPAYSTTSKEASLPTNNNSTTRTNSRFSTTNQKTNSSSTSSNKSGKTSSSSTRSGTSSSGSNTTGTTVTSSAGTASDVMGDATDTTTALTADQQNNTGLDDGSNQLWSASDETSATTDAAQAETNGGTEGSADTASESKSVLHRGTPVWLILLLALLVIGGGFALFYFLSYRKQRGSSAATGKPADAQERTGEGKEKQEEPAATGKDKTE